MKYLIAAIVLPVVLATAAVAAEGEGLSLDGTYVLDAKASDDIPAAVEKATAKVTFLWRGYARKDLNEMHPAYPRIQIAHDATSVVVTFGGSPTQLPMDGTAMNWKREDGEVLTGTVQWRETTLLQTVKKGTTWQRDNDFSLSADGTVLTLKVHFFNKPVNVLLQYRLVYRREAM